MYFLGVWDEITIKTMGAFRSLVLSLCETIYKLIIFCFNVFEKISTAELLDNDTVNILYEKVGLILGIYMIFRLTFVAVQYVLEPDLMIDKQKGASKLLIKSVVVIVLLGTTPFIFNLAYRLQTIITEENVIGKIILNSDTSLNYVDERGYTFGGDLAWYLFSTFYRESENVSGSGQCIELDTDLIGVDLRKNSSLKYAYNCISDTEDYTDINGKEVKSFIIEFDGVLALVVGLGMLWIIVMYTISVGYRLIQLAFLELIAPLPIMMYLEPKNDGPFQKWIKLCVSCYLDYFIRTGIIYFICFLIKNIMDMDDSHLFDTIGHVSDSEYRYIVIIIIFGLLMFAKKIPDLIKEIMPSSGTSFSDFGFSFKKRADNMVGGSYINKGFDKVKGAAKAIGLMPLGAGKRLISGLDSYTHGKGFWNGVTKNPTKVGQWFRKQRETLAPEWHKAANQKREGKENVKFINNKWNKGAELANKLMNNGVKDWTEALDGKTPANYRLLFSSQEFINSKMTVDKVSNKEKTLRYGLEAMKAGNSKGFSYGGKTYTLKNISELARDLDKTQKALNGVKEIHAEVSKQYQRDAKNEQYFDFIKNNSVNPAAVKQTHESENIAIKKKR